MAAQGDMRKLALGLVGYGLFAVGVFLTVIGILALGTLLFEKSWRGNPLLPAAGLPIGIVAVLVAVMIDQRQLKISVIWRAARLVVAGCAVTYSYLALTRVFGTSPVYVGVSAGLFLLATYSWLISYMPKDEVAKGPLLYFVGATQLLIAFQAFQSMNWALFGLASAASLVMLRSIIALKRARA